MPVVRTDGCCFMPSAAALSGNQGGWSSRGKRVTANPGANDNSTGRKRHLLDGRIAAPLLKDQPPGQPVRINQCIVPAYAGR